MAELFKNLYDDNFFHDLTAALQQAWPLFDKTSFLECIHDDRWDEKGLKQRMRHIAQGLKQHLPQAYPEAIIAASLMPAVLGSLVYYLLARFTRDGYRYFAILAVILLLLSFGNPFFGIPNVTVPYAIALNVMHVVVAGGLLYSLKKFAAGTPEPVKR